MSKIKSKAKGREEEKIYALWEMGFKKKKGKSIKKRKNIKKKEN